MSDIEKQSANDAKANGTGIVMHIVRLVGHFALCALGGFAGVLAIVVYGCLVALCVAGTHLIDVMQPRFTFVSQCVMCSTFLFPNSAVGAGFDIFYGVLLMIGVAVVTIWPLFWLSIIYCCHDESQHRDAEECRQWVKKNLLYILFGIPASVVLLHLFGNLHYQFYCAVGVIDSLFEKDSPSACSFMYNGYTLFAGLAGAILTLLFAIFAMALCSPGICLVHQRLSQKPKVATGLPIASDT